MFTLAFWKDRWSRPGGAREVLFLAIPMIISSGSIALMQFTDRVFLTWYDTAAMGASFSAAHILWIFGAFPFSIAGYSNAFVAQYNGARQYSKIATIVWQGFFLGVVVMPVFLLLSPLNHYLFEFFGHDPELTNLESVYLYYLLWGMAPFIGNEAIAAFFSGQKKMATVMNVNLFSVLVNIILDYIFIFGIRGYCEWGLAGAAIATTISQWVRLFIFLFLMFREDWKTGRYHVWRSCRFNGPAFYRLIKYGGMCGVQFVVEMVSYSSFVLLIGMVGAQENAATAIAINLNTLTFLPITGIGVVVVTLVGNHLGANDPQMARRATLTALRFACFITGLFVILFLFFPDLLLAVYAKANPEEFEPLRRMTIILLRFVSLYLFFDTVNIIFSSAIKGAGDTRFVMLTTFITGPLLVLFVWLGLKYFNGGLYWCWTVASSWTFTLCVVYMIRFLLGKWMTMRLDQHDPAVLMEKAAAPSKTGPNTIDKVTE